MEGVAAFDSCSAYQISPMDILYLSHCVPNPPDKGERIRAHHVLKALAAEHRVHLACFARSDEEMRAAKQLQVTCASVYVERLHPAAALARGGVAFLCGGSLANSFFGSTRMRNRVGALAQQERLNTCVVYTTVMAQYAPAGIPVLLDMTDVDSEKWLQYSRMRVGGRLYALEGARLRQCEIFAARRAECTFLATEAERTLLDTIAPGAQTAVIENGVDFSYFDPGQTTPLRELSGRKCIVFVGMMDYYPNVDGVCWFASEVLPALHSAEPELRLYVVGRNPTQRVRALSGRNGVVVTGSVADVRPYLVAAKAVVVPLRMARGIQNKVLEALAMGKPVLASPEVCRAFGAHLPSGVKPCEGADDYRANLDGVDCSGIRRAAIDRFGWARQLEKLLSGVAV